MYIGLRFGSLNIFFHHLQREKPAPVGKKVELLSTVITNQIIIKHNFLTFLFFIHIYSSWGSKCLSQWEESVQIHYFIKRYSNKKEITIRKLPARVKLYNIIMLTFLFSSKNIQVGTQNNCLDERNRSGYIISLAGIEIRKISRF